MASDRAAVIRSALAAYNERDPVAFCAWTTEDVHLQPPASFLQGHAYRGHEGVRQWFRDLEESFARTHIEPKQLRNLDSGVLVLASWSVRGRESQVELVSELGLVCTIQDGLISRWQGYLSHSEAERAAVEEAGT